MSFFPPSFVEEYGMGELGDKMMSIELANFVAIGSIIRPLRDWRPLNPN